MYHGGEGGQFVFADGQLFIEVLGNRRREGRLLSHA
jgi:hypothetical protein